jgi:CheY-like chemotaxis protein
LVLSSEPGVGTSVRIYLPRHTNADEPDSIDAHVAGRGSERILVVEDNADVRNATAALLESLGYTVIKAAHGQAALHTLQTETVDLLLTDLAMPRISGLELADMACTQWPGLKVLLISGSDSAIAKMQSSPANHYEMIRKPFRKQLLAEKIRCKLDD